MPTARHLLVFALLFFAGTAAHYLTRPYVGPIVNRVLNATVAAGVIGILMPDEGVRALGSTVGSGGTYVEVAQGCEGIDVILMLAAAIIAFPMTARKRVLGVLAGTLLLYTANLSRIVGLWYCLRRSPSLFDSMHLLVGQTFLIVMAVTFFAAWTGILGRARG